MLDVDINNTVSGNAKKSLQTILDAMELKSKTLRSLEISTEEDARKLFESVFYARKHFSDVISKTSIPELSYAFSQLKDPSLSYSERVEKFKSTVKGGEREDIEDMAKEIIHFLEPEKYPLWTRWIWNKERGTGSINYVIKDDVKINDEKELFSTIDELRNVLEIFGLESKGKYYITSVF
ncbi:conserved hypothetical protein [Acidianus hospitalis W1]|nr:conserved hypothetical protein [Acidianus hospitalis W1]